MSAAHAREESEIMGELKNRLMQYTALAAAFPCAAASADIVWSGPGLVGSATPDAPFSLDFGPGVGEVFRFSVLTGSYVGSFPAQTFTSNSYTYVYPGGFASIHGRNGVFQFNPANSGGVQDPRFIAPAASGYANDPRLLAYGAPISAGQNFYPMTTNFGASHDLARTTSGFIDYSTGFFLNVNDTYGDWQNGKRGYIGFNIKINGADTFGWVDVEWFPYGPGRGAPALLIHGWAYNAEPRGPITAGEIPAGGPGSVALLALGAAGIRRQRHRR